MQIYISRNNQRFGPYELSHVQADLDSGNIVATDLAWYEGASGWIPVSQIPDIKVPQRRTPPPPPPPALPQPDSPAAPATKPTSGGELALIIIGTLLIPLVGIIVGIVKLSKPEKRNEGWVILGISIALMIFYVIALSGS
jgi:hypothetical protein